MLQFSLRPGCQLVSLLLDVGLRSLHGSIMGCDLGRWEMRERRRESCECLGWLWYFYPYASMLLFMSPML